MNSFAKKVYRYEINSFKLSQMREDVDLSVGEFAELIGWSIAYQYQLEEGKFNTISQKTFDELRSAFARCGLEIEDEK